MTSREIATQYRINQWMQIIQERVCSGEKIDEYCEKKGIKRYTYFYWQRKLREIAGKRLVQQPEPHGISVSKFTEVRMLEGSNQRASVEEAGQVSAEVAGVRIKANSGYPTDKLAALLRELARPC